MKKTILAISTIVSALCTLQTSHAHAETICRARNAKNHYAIVQTFGFDLDTSKAFYIDMLDHDKRVEGEVRFEGPQDESLNIDIKFYTMKNMHASEYKFTEFNVFHIPSSSANKLQMFGGTFYQNGCEAYMQRLIDSNEYECFQI